jgi:hypothetical protein
MQKPLKGGSALQGAKGERKTSLVETQSSCPAGWQLFARPVLRGEQEAANILSEKAWAKGNFVLGQS